MQTASAEIFHCAFIQDKYRSGKPNMASCAMTPDRVFAKENYTPKKGEHCKVEPIYGYEDLEDVVVDLADHTVSWEKKSGLTEYAKPIQKKYYMENGDSETIANEKVNTDINAIRQAFQIWAHQISMQQVYCDEITQKLIDPPTLVPQHSLIFGNKNYTFHMYIPESVAEAILLEPTAGFGHSWVNIRFGKCRKI